MNVALDWDGTVTRDPLVFGRITKLLADAGHKVYILTKRYRSEPVTLEGVDQVIYCCRRPKMEVLNELGIRIDVYIDNDPSDLFG
jgi:hypothetical protein